MTKLAQVVVVSCGCKKGWERGFGRQIGRLVGVGCDYKFATIGSLQHTVFYGRPVMVVLDLH